MGEQYIGPPVTGTLGSFGTLMNLIKPFIGAGILAMPNAWHEGGLISSNIILLVLAYVAGWCIYRLVEASELIMKRDALYNAKLRIARQLRANDLNDQVTEPSYFEAVESVTEKDLIEEDWATVTMPSFTDVGGAAMGRFGRILVDMSIVITQFGACIAYVIFISSNLTSIVGLNTSLWVAILILPFLFLSLIRQMDMLAPTSTLGNVVYLFVISTIFYIGFKDYCCVPFEDLNLSDPSYFPFVFGTCSFALEGIALVMPVKQRMAEPKNFPWIMFAAMCVVTTVYFSFSSLGYMFFGNETLSPVIDSLPKGALTDVIKICLCVSLFFTFALILFPASTFFDEVIDAKLDIDIARDHAKLIEETMNRNVDEVEDVVAIGQAQDNVNVNNNAENDDPASPVAIAPTVEDMYPHLVTKRNSYQNIVRVVSVLFICAVGVAFPDFKLIVALFGSFSNAMLAYIFPAYFWIKVCASTHLYGVEYFPYTRNGDPLRHPLDVVAAQAGHGDNDGNARGDNARGTNYGTNYGSVQPQAQAQGSRRNNRTGPGGDSEIDQINDIHANLRFHSLHGGSAEKKNGPSQSIGDDALTGFDTNYDIKLRVTVPHNHNHNHNHKHRRDTSPQQSPETETETEDDDDNQERDRDGLISSTNISKSTSSRETIGIGKGSNSIPHFNESHVEMKDTTHNEKDNDIDIDNESIQNQNQNRADPESPLSHASSIDLEQDLELERTPLNLRVGHDVAMAPGSKRKNTHSTKQRQHLPTILSRTTSENTSQRQHQPVRIADLSPEYDDLYGHLDVKVELEDKESAIAHKHGEGPFKASCCKKFFVLFFPITVTIAGLASSAIGVYGAINDIIAHYQAE